MQYILIAILLGLVEGITEFIPVSSTGHLLIAEHFLGVRERAPFFATEVFNSFIQVWAMIAALPLFTDRLATLRQPKGRDYLVKLVAALCITIAGVLALKGVMKSLTGSGEFLPKTVWPVTVALIVGGVLFVVLEWMLRGRKGGEQVTWIVAVAIGLAQILAVAFPGTSRSGATILFALALGLARGAATEFSFLLGVPTLGAAAVKTLWDAHKEGVVIEWGPMLVASAVAAMSSFLAVRWLLGYIRTHSFAGFGWYRIGLALLLIVLLAR
jgi:undecaprenyl-diphosphatase